MQEAIIIALIPAIAYVMNFAYEAGFARNLGISPAFISLSFIDVLNNIIPISYSFAFSSTAFYLSLRTYSSNHVNNVFFKIIIVIGIFIVIGLISTGVLFVSNLKYDLFKAKNIKLIVISIFTLGALVLLLTKWGKINYTLADVNLSLYSLILLSIMGMFVISYFQGLLNSKYQVNYAIFPQDSPLIKRVVLRHYGEKLICSDIELEKDSTYKKIENYIVVKMSDQVKLIPDKIGPLKSFKK